MYVIIKNKGNRGYLRITEFGTGITRNVEYAAKYKSEEEAKKVIRSFGKNNSFITKKKKNVK